MVAQLQAPQARTANAAPLRRPTIADVQRAVAEHYGLPPLALVSSRRWRPLAHARHLAIWLSRRLTAHSHERIGERFYLHNSTVCHACAVVPDRLEADPKLRADCAAILRHVDQIRRNNVLSFPVRRGDGPVSERLDALAADLQRNPAEALSALLGRLVDGPELEGH